MLTHMVMFESVCVVCVLCCGACVRFRQEDIKMNKPEFFFKTPRAFFV